MAEGEKQQRSFFFQPNVSRANSANSVGEKEVSVNQNQLALTYSALSAEGELLLRQGDYQRAIASLNKALEIKPGERQLLVFRSRCYMHLGKVDQSLRDANRALESDKTFFRAVLQKAEAHFAAGDFEVALIYYHRGSKIRSDVDDFRLGIQKSQEAIEDAINGDSPQSPSSPEQNAQSDQAEKISPDASPKPQSRNTTSKQTTRKDPSMSILSPVKSAQSKSSKDSTDTASRLRSRRLLGKLCSDKMYLEQLVKEKDPLSKDSVQSLARVGLVYLDKREDFWRQHNANEGGTVLPPPTRQSLDQSTDRNRTPNKSLKKNFQISPSNGARAASVPVLEHGNQSSMILPPIAGAQSHPKSAGQLGFMETGSFSLSDNPTVDALNKTNASAHSNMAHSNSPPPPGRHNRHHPQPHGPTRFELLHDYVANTHMCMQQLQHIQNAIDAKDGNTAVRFAADFLPRFRTVEIPDKYKLTIRLYFLVAKGYSLVNQHSLAAVYYRLVVELSMEHFDKSNTMKALAGLGGAFQSMGDYARAIELYEYQLRSGEDVEVPDIHIRMAQCHAQANNPTMALTQANMSIQWIEQKGVHNKSTEARYTQYKLHAVTIMASCLETMGKPRDAVQKYEAALVLVRKLPELDWEIEILGSMVGLYTKLVDPEKTTTYQQQLTAVKQKKDKLNQIKSMQGLTKPSSREG